MQTSKEIKDELLDIVNQNDEVIGTLPRSEVYSNKMSNFRVINVFIVNDQGQLWIPRRSKHKRVFPLALDVSVGGHVESGETYDEAMAREVLEEVNLDTSNISYKILGNVNPNKHKVSAYSRVYEIKSNVTPRFNPEDFTEYFWLSPMETLQKIKNGDQSKDDLPKLIKIFYL